MSPRRSGILVPLFSMRSSRSWGIGEFLDLPDLAGWLRAAHQTVLQILPLTEVPESETSPYSALTGMALDPVYISLPAVEDFDAIGGNAALSAADREALAHAQRADAVRYHDVRRLKDSYLRKAHQHFRQTALAAHGERARAYQSFIEANADWLDEFALFRALRDRYSRQPWWEWPRPLSVRDPAALRAAESELHEEIEYRKYGQWLAAEQWEAARRRAAPIRVFGDVPFMISADSPDVWARQDEFNLEATVGVPPDAFSETGQDWGLPPLRWDVMAQNDFEWIRRRARRTAQLFDGFRLDHLVGLYRTYIRPVDQSVSPFFSPPDEAAQIALGEKLVSIYRDTGAEIIAEDLGTVPECVRESLETLRVPGFKVLRWERHWAEQDQPYIDPREYPAASVATTGTHDTEPLVCWWESLSEDERAEVLRLPSLQRHLSVSPSDLPLDAIVQALLDSSSSLALLPIQDVFGWRDRINTPAQVSEGNWTWVLPWPVDRLLEIADSRERAESLARWTAAARRR